jgi:hypothetical protein
MPAAPWRRGVGAKRGVLDSQIQDVVFNTRKMVSVSQHQITRGPRNSHSATDSFLKAFLVSVWSQYNAESARFRCGIIAV